MLLGEIARITGGRIIVKDAIESARAKELREAIRVNKEAGNMPNLVAKLEKELEDELKKETIRQDSKDGGPGSGQEGHKTSHKENIQFIRAQLEKLPAQIEEARKNGLVDKVKNLEIAQKALLDALQSGNTSDGALSDLFGGTLDPLLEVTEKEAVTEVRDDIKTNDYYVKETKGGWFGVFKSGVTTAVAEYKTKESANEMASKMEVKDTTDEPFRPEVAKYKRELEDLKSDLADAQKRGDKEDEKFYKDKIQELEADIEKHKGETTEDGGPGSGVEGHKTNRPSKPQGYEALADKIRRIKHSSTLQVHGEAKKEYEEAKKNLYSKDPKEKADAWKKMTRLVKMEEKKKSLGYVDSISFTPKEATEIGQKAGVDFAKINLEQFRMGLDVEQEHKDLTQGDPGMTVKIVLAHLMERENYYSLLKKMESGAVTKDEKRQYHITEGAFYSRITASSPEEARELYIKSNPKRAPGERIWVEPGTVKSQDGGPGSGFKGHVTMRQKLLKRKYALQKRNARAVLQRQHSKDIKTEDPLTAKGEEIMKAMIEKYGEEKGKQVFLCFQK